MILRLCLTAFLCIPVLIPLYAQSTYLLRPDRVFDEETMLENWAVWVKGGRIAAVGREADFPAGARQAEVIDLKGTTLLPGLIEGHAHLFLHPYNETSWDDQVLKESRA